MEREERDNLVRYLFEETELTYEQMADVDGLSYKIVWNTIQRLYSEEQRKARKSKNYTKAANGAKYMQGRTREQHHNWIGGEVSDGKGYIMVIKPLWYTGRPGSKYVFKHSVVMCEALGLTEMPKGFIVHHINGDPKDNDIHNLALMTSNAHSRLHQLLKRVTTIPQGSRA